MPKARKTVYHLGTAGHPGEPKFKEVHDYAHENPRCRVVSVDCQPHRGEMPENMEHRQGNFTAGLESEPDNSVHEIHSKMALGFFGYADGKTTLDPKENSVHAFSVCRKKLVPGGFIEFYIGGLMQKPVAEELLEAGFEKSKIRITRAADEERLASHWLRNYKGFVFKVRAEK